MLKQKHGFITSILKRQPRHPSSGVNSKPTEVFKAMARMPWAKNHVPVVFKIFKPQFQNTAIHNELLIHKMAKQAGLPVSEDVRFCPCLKATIPGPSECVKGRDPNSEWLSGVASVDASNNRIVQLANRSGRILPLLLNELRAWPYYPYVAVFDELIMNVDRTTSNIYRIGQSKFILIDHAESLGGQNWSLEFLRKNIYKTSLSNHVAADIGRYGTSQVQNLMVNIAVDYSKNIKFTEKSLNIDFTELDSICKLETGTTSEVIKLLNKRVRKLPELVFQHMKQYQLIQ